MLLYITLIKHQETLTYVFTGSDTLSRKRSACSLYFQWFWLKM